MKVTTVLLSMDLSNTMTVTSWYTTELYFPYDPTAYFSDYPIVYNSNICLSSVSNTKDSVLGDERMSMTAIKVEYIKNPDSLFQIPNGFSVYSGKISEFLKDTGATKITVREIRLEELKQEEVEKPEPPPPPPPKAPKSSKTPAKKEKQKPVKG